MVEEVVRQLVRQRPRTAAGARDVPPWTAISRAPARATVLAGSAPPPTATGRSWSSRLQTPSRLQPWWRSEATTASSSGGPPAQVVSPIQGDSGTLPAAASHRATRESSMCASRSPSSQSAHGVGDESAAGVTRPSAPRVKPRARSTSSVPAVTEVAPGCRLMATCRAGWPPGARPAGRRAQTASGRRTPRRGRLRHLGARAPAAGTGGSCRR